MKIAPGETGRISTVATSDGHCAVPVPLRRAGDKWGLNVGRQRYGAGKKQAEAEQSIWAITYTHWHVPSHFGITGSRSTVPCTSFEARANARQVLEGVFFFCDRCGYRVADTATGGPAAKPCPRCGSTMRVIICVAAPAKAGTVQPTVKVF